MSGEGRVKGLEVRGKSEEVSPLFPPRSSLKPPRSHLLALFSTLLALPSSLFAQQGYTNHAGNVIAGWPVALTATQVSLSEELRAKSLGLRAKSEETSQDSKLQAPSSKLYPLSIFPESEQRRIAADFGSPRLPPAVKRAIDGAEKAMARSRKRAEKGLCTKDESEAFCVKSSAALRTYLDKQVESGTITPAERKAIGR